MNAEQQQEYRELCQEMRAWPAELAARLKDAPPIGLHFFIWRELTHPEYYRLYYEAYPAKWVVEEPSWDKLQAANEGRVAQAISGWEKWDKLPSGGRICFFGRGNFEDADKWLAEIKDVLKKAEETITKYQQLSIPSHLWWKAQAFSVCPHGNRPKEWFRLLSLIGLATGCEYDDHEILIQEDDSDTFTPCEQEFIHEPWDGVRIGTDIYVLQDFVHSFAGAVKMWIPDGLEDTPLPVKEEPMLTSAQSTYMFRFGGKIWYLRFPGDYGDKVHEYGEMNGLLFYAKLLERKGKPVSADDLYEIDRAKLGPQSKPEPAIDAEGLKAAYTEFERLTDEIRDARETGNLEKARELVKSRNKLQDSIKKDLNPKTGRSKLMKGKEIENPPRAAEKAMRDALREIGGDMPKLQRYLFKTCRKISQDTWQYEPTECEPRTELPWEFYLPALDVKPIPTAIVSFNRDEPPAPVQNDLQF